MKMAARILSPILIIALLLSAVAVLAPIGAAPVKAEWPAPFVEMVQPPDITDPSTLIQIYGNDFQPGAVVNFGGYLAIDSMWISPSEVDAHIDPLMPNGPYWVQVMNPDGQYSNSFFEIFVDLTPPGLAADFSATPTTGGAPLTVQFTDESTGPRYEWWWDFGDGYYSIDQNPSHTYNAPGTYDVYLEVYGPGYLDYDTESKLGYITVTEPVQVVNPARVEATLHPGESIIVEKVVTLPSEPVDTVYTVEPVVNNDTELDVTYDPIILEGVPAGSTANFQETITAPEDIAPGKYDFSVEFLANGEFIGIQEVSIIVPGLSPMVVNAVMHSGETIHVDKNVFIPGSGQMGVDIFLLQDETGSYGSYIDSLQALAPDIFDAIQAMVPDSRFGVGGFRDFPWDPWGDYGDWPYRLIQDLTTDRAAFLDGVGLLTANGGNDGPEAQYSALYQTATGAGIDLNSDGDYTGPGEVAPGLNPSFRPDALKVVILPTDADFHPQPYDSGYPGPSRDQVIAALQDAGIVVIGIDSYYGASNPQLQDVADATGGVNISLSGTSGEAIAEAIMNGLGSVLSYTVKPVVVDAAPLVVTFDPAMYEHVNGNSALSFTENITVPWCTPEGEYSFTVEFWANDQFIGVQTVNIDVQPYPWTTLVYMAGDNSSSDQAWGALQSIGNAPFDMNPVLVLFDGGGNGDSQIFRKSYEGMVPMDDAGAVIKKNHEVNMGDPETLENFINWGRSHGHADNYLLVLWDQGAGWRTSRFLKDWTSYGDDITLKELSDALAGATDDGADPLQIIGFDASLMQMLEVDYAIEPYAQYAVGSEEIIPHEMGIGWPYGMILYELSSNPDLTPAELATMITEAYGNRWTSPYPEYDMYYSEFPGATLSAKDLSQIDALAEATNAFAVQLLGAIGSFDTEMASARAMTEEFGNMFQQSPDGMHQLSPGSIDLYHFAELIAANVPDGALNFAANAVMEAVDAAVIANVHGPMHPNAHGIAIYYPDIERPMGYGGGPGDGPGGGPENLQVMVYEPAYDVDVPFAADTLWNEYLKQAPRLVDQGMLAMYIPDVMLLAHVYQDPIVRFEWPGTTAGYLPDGFTLSKPVNIIVTPEGAIDIGEVAILYNQADLNNAGILNTQLIGIASSDGEAWGLEKLTENLPTWMFDKSGMMDGPGGPTEPMTMDGGPFDPMEFLYGIESLGDMLMGMVMGDVMEGKHYTPGYIGAVVAVPWLDFTNMAPQVYDMIPNLPAVSSDVNASLAMIATVQEDYLTPIQSPQDLYKGWNLISLPVIPLDNSVETILSGHDGLVEGVADSVEVIWSYDAATETWHRYIPSAPEASDLTELKDGAGYWVNMNEDATLTVLGSNFLAGPHAPPEYDLVEGWNLIGYKGILPMAPQGEWYYSEYYDEWSEQWYYNEVYIGGYLEADKVTYNRLQGYDRLYDSLITPEFLNPNDGYWIYIPEGGAGSIPGLNDEVWINAVQNGMWELFDAAYNWKSRWMMHDGDLGMRLYWNMRWYGDWVITPSMINYWGGYYGPGPS